MDSETREMICIMCPMGCHLTVTQKDGEIEVSGNNCIRGENFAKEELSCPKRTVTTSVKTEKGVKACKTTKPIPKSMIFDCIKEVEKLRLKDAKYGDIVIENVLGTGADIIITAND
jgi:CxxC motif-containing protein